MSQIIPAGGKKMEWVKDPEQTVTKTAQGMFDDDPQLDAIKGLPGMQDGIDELTEMSNDEVIEDVPPSFDGVTSDQSVGSGSIEQAVQKVTDAAKEVVTEVTKEIKEQVSEAVSNAGVIPVSEKTEDKKEVKEDSKPEDEKKDDNEEFEFEISDVVDDKCKKCDKDDKDDKDDEIPGVEGDTEDKDGIEKKSDEDEEPKEDKTSFAAGKGMKRLAELSSGEVKELRHYWQSLCGMPKEYVDAMLKTYKA